MKRKIPRNAILLGGAQNLKKELVFCEVNHLMEQKHWPTIEVIALHITQNVQVNQTHWTPKVLYYVTYNYFHSCHLHIIEFIVITETATTTTSTTKSSATDGTFKT